MFSPEPMRRSTPTMRGSTTTMQCSTSPKSEESSAEVTRETLVDNRDKGRKCLVIMTILVFCWVLCTEAAFPYTSVLLAETLNGFCQLGDMLTEFTVYEQVFGLLGLILGLSTVLAIWLDKNVCTSSCELKFVSVNLGGGGSKLEFNAPVPENLSYMLGIKTNDQLIDRMVEELTVDKAMEQNPFFHQWVNKVKSSFVVKPNTNTMPAIMLVHQVYASLEKTSGTDFLKGENKVTFIERVNLMSHSYLPSMLRAYISMDPGKLSPHLDSYNGEIPWGEFTVPDGSKVTSQHVESTLIWDLVQSLMVHNFVSNHDAAVRDAMVEYLARDETESKMLQTLLQVPQIIFFQEGVWNQQANELNGVRVPFGWKVAAREKDGSYTGIILPPGVDQISDKWTPDYNGENKVGRTTTLKYLGLEAGIVSNTFNLILKYLGLRADVGSIRFNLIVSHNKEAKTTEDIEAALEPLDSQLTGNVVTILAGDFNHKDELKMWEYKQALAAKAAEKGYQLVVVAPNGPTTSKMRNEHCSVQVAKWKKKAESTKDMFYILVPNGTPLPACRIDKIFAAFTKPEEGMPTRSGDHDVPILSLGISE